MVREAARTLSGRLRGLGLKAVHQKAVAVIVVVQDPPKSYPVGCLQSRCSSAASAVQLVGMTLGDEGEAHVDPSFGSRLRTADHLTR